MPRGVSDKETAIVSAQEFVRGREEGQTVAEATTATGASPQSSVVQALLEASKAKARELARISSAERRELLIGRMTEIMLTGEDKDAIAASRVLTADPDLGFQQQPLVGIVISEEVLGMPGRVKFRQNPQLLEPEQVEEITDGHDNL